MNKVPSEPQSGFFLTHFYLLASQWLGQHRCRAPVDQGMKGFHCPRSHECTGSWNPACGFSYGHCASVVHPNRPINLLLEGPRRAQECYEAAIVKILQKFLPRPASPAAVSHDAATQGDAWWRTAAYRPLTTHEPKWILAKPFCFPSRSPASSSCCRLLSETLKSTSFLQEAEQDLSKSAGCSEQCWRNLSWLDPGTNG